MASMTEAIRLVINGDSKGGVSALKDLDNAMSSTGKKIDQDYARSFGKYGQAAKAASSAALWGFTILGAFIGKSVKDYADFAIIVGKVSAQTDMGAEATSRFVGQLQFFHADASKAGMAVKTLEKGIYGLETGSKASVDTFKILGLTWADLKNLKPEDQMALIRDRLSEIKDPAARAAAAGTLLGRGAKDMALWYTASSDAMGKVNDQLQKNGQIMTEGQVKDAEKAAAAWKSFTGALKGTEYGIARGVLPSATKLLGVLAFLLQKLRPFTPVLMPLTVLLGVFGGTIKGIVAVQKTWNQLLGLLPARLVKAKVAEEGATVATRAGTGAMKAQMVTLGMYGIALAAAAVAIYGIVKAYQSWQQAAQQAAEAAAGAQATLDKNAAKLGPQQTAQIQAQINADKYKSPGLGGWLGSAGQGIWDTYLYPMWGGLQGKKYGAGGDFIARGAQQIVVGDNPVGERVTVTPLNRKGAGDVTELHVHNHFHGPVVGGKAGLRELTDIMSRSLGPQVDRLQRGRFAGA